MTIKELLIDKGIPASEVRSRLISGQVKLNGMKVCDPNFDLGMIEEFQELGDFLINMFSEKMVLLTTVITPDIRLLFGTLDNETCNIQCLNFLKNFNCLQVSKKESWVFKNNSIVSL